MTNSIPYIIFSVGKSQSHLYKENTLNKIFVTSTADKRFVLESRHYDYWNYSNYKSVQHITVNASKNLISKWDLSVPL